jgi:hypothetical protein
MSGKIVWAHQELRELLGSIADLVVRMPVCYAMCIPLSSDLSPQYLVSPDRKTFLAEFGPGGKHENTVGIYRGNESSEKIGVFDKDLINGLPSSVKWIAHNGAGYDPVDVHACKSRGTPL